MIKLVKDLCIQTRRYVIADEVTIMSILKAIDEVKRDSRFHVLMHMEVGNCGWLDEPTMWFVHCDMTEKQWTKFVTELSKAKFELKIREDGHIYVAKK